MAMTRLSNGSRPIEFAVIMIILATLASLILPAIQEPRGGGPRHVCQNNLKQIGLALSSYHEKYDCFPPPYVADANGIPMHSWRVLILPFVDGSDIYNRYDFSEPWNGPHNSLLADKMPHVYGCPSHKAGNAESSGWKKSVTNYLAIIGTRTPFQSGKTRRLAEVGGVPGEQVMVVEYPTSNVNWMQPVDLNTSAGPRVIRGIRHWNKNEKGVNVMMVDGSVKYFPAGSATSDFRVDSD